MIDFRYHVVSIVAVFLALALGLFVGSTTLQSTVTDQLKGAAQSVRNDNKKLETQRDTLRSQLSDVQQFDAAVEPTLVRGALAGQTVVVVSAPGVSDSVRQGLGTTLEAAGAVVTADVRLTSAYVDPTESEELGQLAHDLSPTASEPSTGSGVDDASRALAAVLGIRAGHSTPPANTVQTTLSAFEDGKLITVSGDDPRPATLGIVLLPATDPTLQPAVLTQQATDVAALARDLDTTTAGVVVTGPAHDPDAPDGLFEATAKRLGTPAQSGVSTASAGDITNASDQSYGRVATVLALAQQRTGGAGSYGLGASSPLPSASPTP
jgi:hypothetical protein